MSKIGQKDAKIWSYDFEYRAMKLMLTTHFDGCESLLWIDSDSVIVHQAIGVEFCF